MPVPPPNRTRATANRGHVGRYLLYGISVVGAVILLLIGSFSGPVTAVGNPRSTFADAQVPVSQPAVTTSPIEVEVAVNSPLRGEEEDGWDDVARQADVVAEQKYRRGRLRLCRPLRLRPTPFDQLSASSITVARGASVPTLPSRAVARGCSPRTRTLAATTSVNRPLPRWSCPYEARAPGDSADCSERAAGFPALAMLLDHARPSIAGLSRGGGDLSPSRKSRFRYTQIVWGNTRALGCASSRSRGTM